MKRLFLSFILLLALSINCQDNPFLLSIDSLSEDVYYDLEGSWKFDLSAAVQGDPSTIAENTIFKMTPNLTASIWLFNKFFFETEVKELSLNNLFLFGYQNSDFGLQEVRIGNSELNIESYAGYKPSSSQLNTPGARFKIVTENSTQEGLFRYTKEVSETVKFIGNNIINDNNFKLNNYVTGRFFILPEGINNFTIYSLKDNELKAIDRKDYVFYNDKNLIYILEDYEKIYFESDLDKTTLYNFTKEIPFIEASETEDSLWNNYLEKINNKELIKLYIPGEFTTFQFLGAYELDNEISADNSLIVLGKKSIHYEIIDEYLILYNKSLEKNDVSLRYPFINENSDIYYVGGTGLNIVNDLTFRELTKSETFYIDENVRDNSINVSINGIVFTDFSFEPESGVLTINREITQFDEVEVSYKKDSDPGTGNLLGVYGSSFTLTENLKLELSSKVNWNILTEEYTTEAYESIGDIESIGEITYSSERVSAGLKSSIKVLKPDTSNGLELLSYSNKVKTVTAEMLTFNSTLPGINETSLIDRETNNGIYTDSEVNNLTATGLNQPYFINHKIGENINTSVIIETEDIPNGNYSNAILNIDDITKDYSWAKKINFTYYSTKNREVELAIGNLSKSITLESNGSYKTYTIELTPQERKQLQYVNSIKLKVNEGDSFRLYFKDIMFEGDRFWTNESTSTIKTSISSNRINIDNLSSGDIKLKTSINESNWDYYKKLELVVDNSNLITSSSTLEISILNTNGFNRKYIISGEKIGNGKNTISLNLESENYTALSNTKGENSITIEVLGSKAGNAIIHPIYLKDPIYEITNSNSAYIEIKPNLSLKIFNFPLFETKRIYIKGDYNNVTGNYSGNMEGVLLAGEYEVGSSGRNSDITEVNYSYKFPYNSPVYIKDSFKYSTYSLRENSLVINTSPLDIELKMSGIKNEETFIRGNTLEAAIKSPLKIGILTELSQEEDSNLTPEIEDIFKSYHSLALEDGLGNKNNFISNLDLSTTIGLYKWNIGFVGNFIQKWDTSYVNNSSYSFIFSNGVDFVPFSLSISWESNYKYLQPGSMQKDLGEGFNEYMDIFINTNPYNNANIIDLFYTDSYSTFFNNENEKNLSNNTTLSFTNNIFPTSNLNMATPENILFSLKKNYSQKGDLPIVDMEYSAGIDFTKNSQLKNKVTYEYTRSILNSEDNSTLSIESIFLNPLEKSNLDISNNYKISNSRYTNIIRTDYSWKGKSGPLFIIPLVGFLIDSPYSYNHTERVYLKLENSKYRVGLRHETKLVISDTNETEAYIDVGYENSSTTPFSMGIGIYTTLIF